MPLLEKILLAVIICFCGLLLVEALDINPPARTFPLVVTGLAGALAAFALVRSVARPLTGPVFPPRRGHVVFAGAAGLVVYAVAMSVSYLAATLAFLFIGYVFLMPQRSAKSVSTAAIVAVATTAFTWLCFSYWLGVNLP